MISSPCLKPCILQKEYGLDKNLRYTSYPRTLLWLVRGGEITIGGPEEDAQPEFKLELEPFYISKFPITNEQYQAFDPNYERPPHFPNDKDPAVRISQEEALAYTAWYAAIARKPFRLPTEFEWEYACRAGSESRYYFEDPAEADAHIWSLENSADRYLDLEAKKPNRFGLYGMLGGVWDWTDSSYAPYPPRDSDPGSRPARAGSQRVLRGGSFTVSRKNISCSLRRAEPPDARFDDVGFRIVKDLRPKKRS